MVDRQPTTQTMSLADAEHALEAVVDRVQRNETRVILERNGRPVVAIVSADDLDRWQRRDREREERFRILDEFGAAFRDAPAAEIDREAGRAVARARALLRGGRNGPGPAE